MGKAAADGVRGLSRAGGIEHWEVRLSCVAAALTGGALVGANGWLGPGLAGVLTASLTTGVQLAATKMV